MDDRYEKLKQIKDEVLILKTSPLYQYRINHHYYPVIGQGNHYAKLMFIAEAPGEKEAQTGKPFVGSAGKVLDDLLKTAHLTRRDIYITNIVKDRPPGNNTPTPELITTYSPFISRQIEIIQPLIIATLGRISLEWVWNHYGQGLIGKISQIHGQKQSITINSKPAYLFPLYHPAVALYDQTKLATMKADIQNLTKLLNQ